MNDGKKRTIKRVIQRCGCDKILPLTLVTSSTSSCTATFPPAAASRAAC